MIRPAAQAWAVACDLRRDGRLHPLGVGGMRTSRAAGTAVDAGRPHRVDASSLRMEPHHRLIMANLAHPLTTVIETAVSTYSSRNSISWTGSPSPNTWAQPSRVSMYSRIRHTLPSRTSYTKQ